MNADIVHHVVILGCGRSGTSIFGELFEHLAPYTYYSEPSFAELMEFDFEAMIQSPRQFANAICREVRLDIGAHESALAEWSNRIQNTNNEKFVEAKTSRHYSRADHHTRVDRWKENLNREDIRSVTSILQKTAKQFGYSLNQEQNVN
jgi:hypothetical protein